MRSIWEQSARNRRVSIPQPRATDAHHVPGQEGGRWGGGVFAEHLLILTQLSKLISSMSGICMALDGCRRDKNTAVST